MPTRSGSPSEVDLCALAVRDVCKITDELPYFLCWVAHQSEINLRGHAHADRVAALTSLYHAAQADNLGGHGYRMWYAPKCSRRSQFWHDVALGAMRRL